MQVRDILAALARPYRDELARLRAAIGVAKTTVVDAAIDLPSINANLTGYVDVAVAGAKTTQSVSLQLLADLPAGIAIAGVKVQAANTVRVFGLNYTAAPVNAASFNGRFTLLGE